MVLSESQWKDIKRVNWNKAESRRIQRDTHDDKLMVGWCNKKKRWMIARVIDVTVMTSFGVKTIPTREKVPYTWKVWEDDDGGFLHVRDRRLIPFIRRCDLWRQGSDKYMAQFDHADWLRDGRERSDGDELEYAAKQAFSRVKKWAYSQCGYDYMGAAKPQRFFFGS